MRSAMVSITLIQLMYIRATRRPVSYTHLYTVTVADEGRGVTPEELARIAEPFYMVDKSRARKEGGAGLGLALCRKIIDLHQGSWQFESEPGKGMRITVRFGLPEATGRERVRRRRTAKKERKESKKAERSRHAGRHTL